jgi:hypothetical protein
VGTSVSMCLQVAPHKIVQPIKIRTAKRPAVLRDQVVVVVLEPLDGPVGDMAGGRVLPPHPRKVSCYCLDPGKDGTLHDLQIDVRIDPEPSLKDVGEHDSMLLTFLEAIGAVPRRLFFAAQQRIAIT